MPFLDKLESRFGRFAIPGFVSYIAGLQVLTYLLFAMLSPEARAMYQDFLILDADQVLKGQVWRLVTYIFVPTGMSFIFVILVAMFQIWLGRGLEEAWGAFRVMLYYISGMLALAISAMILGYSPTRFYLFECLLFAFAVIYPNEEIRLWFIIPVKIKWIAWLHAALTILYVLAVPTEFWMVLCAHLNFLITFGPAFIKERQHMAKVGQRRAAFESGSNSGAAFFHQCTVCQKTEVDDPKLDFRVNAEGDEICADCRAKAQNVG